MGLNWVPYWTQAAVAVAIACEVWWLPASAALQLRPRHKEDRRPGPPSVERVPWGKSSRVGQTRQDHRRTRQVTPLPCHCGKTGVGRGTSRVFLILSSRAIFTSRGERRKIVDGPGFLSAYRHRCPKPRSLGLPPPLERGSERRSGLTGFFSSCAANAFGTTKAPGAVEVRPDVPMTRESRV